MSSTSESLSPDDKPASKSGLFGAALAALQSDNTTELSPYLPSELIGGSIPHIPGTEDEAVWNAAVQACGTERVHYCYTINDGRCWYLAAPSSAFASNPDSWCPLAAALPGNSEHWDRETVYLYEQEGAAVALRWDIETGRMQVYSGAARTILPKVQSMDANFVTISADSATVIPWKNRSLRQDALSRQTIKWLFFSGLFVALSALLYWLGGYLTAATIKPRLAEAQEATDKATTELMVQAANTLQSDAYKHLSRIQDLLEILAEQGGTLVVYEVSENGQISWEALIPPALGGDYIASLGAKPLELEASGRLRIRGNR